MGTHYRFLIWLLITFATSAVVGPAWSQQADQKTGEQAGEQTGEEATEKVVVTEPDSPAVAAVLATKPSTPADMTRAAKVLSDLGRPDLARDLIKKVLAANLDQRQLAALEEQFGSALFLTMASRGDLAPEGKQLADLVMTAANSVLEDPARLAELVKQIQDPSAEVRIRALNGLKRARGAGVAPLLAVLADPARSDEYTNVRAALVQLGGSALGPLRAALESPDANLTVEVIRVLAELGPRESIVYLLAPSTSDRPDAKVREAAQAAMVKTLGQTPGKKLASEMLLREAQEHFQRLHPPGVDGEGRVKVWSWDAATGQPVGNEMTAAGASLALAARFAREAYSVDTESDEIRLLYLATLLEQAAYENGLDKPLTAQPDTPAAKVAGFGASVVEDVLKFAVDAGHSVAATAAARILGQIGSAEELLCQGPQPSTLVRAAQHDDRRLRFAAVEAILALDPQKPFAGSSRVGDVLISFATSSGRRGALVAAPTSQEALRIGGYLVAMGYELEIAVTGRELIQAAIASSDYELALVDTSIDRPTAALLIQQLRHDYRTAELPVALMARSGRLAEAERIAAHDRLVAAFPRPHNAETVQRQVEQLLALPGREAVALDERRHQALQSLRWLAELSGSDQKIFNVQRAQAPAMAALFSSDLGSDAIAILGNLGTPEAQTSLVDLASRWTQPLEVRKAAAEAFWKNTAEHGILLTSKQLRVQYDRYNQSRHRDSSTQQILASILNCIEAPSKAKQQASAKGRIRGQ